MKKLILLTGATSGIGLAVAEGIAAEGHHLVFTARDEAKAIRLQTDLTATYPAATVEYLLADFASLPAVAHLAETYLSRYDHLDVLINNAGVWETEFRESQDGIEINFAVNHLAPFLLTNRLLPALMAAPAGRIVNTSSMAHRRNILDFDDPEWRTKPYDSTATYSQSKLLILLFTLQLVENLRGTSVTANSVHPGYVQSNLFNQMGPRDWQGIPPASDGARSTLFAALWPVMAGVNGQYIYHEQADRPIPTAYDHALALQAWAKSERYIQRALTAANVSAA